MTDQQQQSQDVCPKAAEAAAAPAGEPSGTPPLYPQIPQQPAPPQYRPDAPPAYSASETVPTKTETTANARAKEEEQDWSSGLFGCFSDVIGCALTCLFPLPMAVVVGRRAQLKTLLHPLLAFVAATFILFLVAFVLGFHWIVPLVLWVVVSEVLACFLIAALRHSFRQKYAIQGTLLTDMCVSFYCAPCAICQMKRQLDCLHTVDQVNISRV